MTSVKHILGLTLGLAALTACVAPVPDSGAGVGFDDYADYELERARREAILRGETPPAAQPQVGGNGPISTTELSNAGLPSAASPQPAENPVAQGPLGSNPGISDEQNFDAVSGRESIESDAERRARQAAAYQLIETTALPDRSGRSEPNIVAYALQAPNNRGERVFDRGGFNAQARFQRNCAKYRTPDAAQRDFLSRGGPQRDRLGLDPDGDGFACGWDPQAFRSVASGN